MSGGSGRLFHQRQGRSASTGGPAARPARRSASPGGSPSNGQFAVEAVGWTAGDLCAPGATRAGRRGAPAGSPAWMLRAPAAGLGQGRAAGRRGGAVSLLRLPATSGPGRASSQCARRHSGRSTQRSAEFAANRRLPCVASVTAGRATRGRSPARDVQRRAARLLARGNRQPAARPSDQARRSRRRLRRSVPAGASAAAEGYCSASRWLLAWRGVSLCGGGAPSSGSPASRRGTGPQPPYWNKGTRPC